MDLPPAYVAALDQVATQIAGPLVMGNFIVVLFYGVFITQINTYWRSKNEDPWLVKLAVVFMSCIATLQCAIGMFIAYHYSISSFGNIEKVLSVIPPDAVMVLCDALAGATMQAFFAWRVYKLTRWVWLPVFVLMLALTETGIIFYCVVRVTQLSTWAGLSEVRTPILVWSSASPLADILVSGALIYHLRRKRTGFAATDDILSKINRLTLQTGFITVVWTITSLILYVTYPTTLYAFFILYPLGMVYAVCFMSSLNSRANWNDRSHDSARVHVYKSTTAHHDVELASAPATVSQARSHASLGAASNLHFGVISRARSDEELKAAVSPTSPARNYDQTGAHKAREALDDKFSVDTRD